MCLNTNNLNLCDFIHFNLFSSFSIFFSCILAALLYVCVIFRSFACDAVVVLQRFRFCLCTSFFFCFDVPWSLISIRLVKSASNEIKPVTPTQQLKTLRTHRHSKCGSDNFISLFFSVEFYSSVKLCSDWIGALLYLLHCNIEQDADIYTS